MYINKWLMFVLSLLQIQSYLKVTFIFNIPCTNSHNISKYFNLEIFPKNNIYNVLKLSIILYIRNWNRNEHRQS